LESTHYLSSSQIFKFDLSTTDVEEKIIDNETVTIFPNPASDYLSIKGIDNQSVRIYTIEGIKIIDTQNSAKIDLRNLSNGIYFLEIGDKTYHFIIYK
jgi:hypothetical protein